MNNIERVIHLLDKLFPHPGAMEIGDAYQTLVAVVLSARTRDEQVLKLLPMFFQAFPDVFTLACATPKQIERKISTIGMYHQKAKHLRTMAGMLLERFDGMVPASMEDLVSLPGVGRKTASVVLVACFHQPAIAVDTHVHRVTNRLGWIHTRLPAQTERVLLTLIPRKLQTIVNRVFVKFGRSVCLPGRPRCYLCPIQSFCLYAKKQLNSPHNVAAIEKKIQQKEEQLESMRRQVVEFLRRSL